MRKKLCGILAGVLLCTAQYQNISAETFDDCDVYNSGDYEDILEYDASSKRFPVDYTNGAEKASQMERIIDYDNALKVYQGFDLFREEKMTEEELQNVLETADYRWKIPMYHENGTVMITYGRLPESESEDKVKRIDMLFLQNHRNYREEVIQALEENGISIEDVEVYFVEDVPGYRHILALIAQDGEITHAIPLYTELYLEESQGISTKAAQPGTVLDFDKVNTDMVKAMQQAAAESTGEILLGSGSATADGTETQNTWSKYTLIVAGIAAAAVLFGIGVAVKNKLHNNKQRDS